MINIIMSVPIKPGINIKEFNIKFLAKFSYLPKNAVCQVKNLKVGRKLIAPVISIPRQAKFVAM